MAENEAKTAVTPAATQQSKSRQQLMEERFQAKIERARTPGATVIQPNNPKMYEIVHLVREIDRSVAFIENDIFDDNETVRKRAEEGALLFRNVIAGLREAAEKLSTLANREFRPFRSSSQANRR